MLLKYCSVIWVIVIPFKANRYTRRKAILFIYIKTQKRRHNNSGYMELFSFLEDKNSHTDTNKRHKVNQINVDKIQNAMNNEHTRDSILLSINWMQVYEKNNSSWFSITL